MTQAALIGKLSTLTGLRFAPPNLGTHLLALGMLSEPELDAAVARAARECSEFPSPSVLLQFVEEWRKAQPVPQDDDRSVALAEPVTYTVEQVQATIRIEREWKYYHEACHDTGWASRWCPASTTRGSPWPWVEVEHCGSRRAIHTPHEWVKACSCAETNPDVQRRRHRARQVTRGGQDHG